MCVCVCALVFVSVSVCLCFCVLALERMMYISEQVHTKKSSISVLSISASIRFQISRNGFQGIWESERHTWFALGHGFKFKEDDGQDPQNQWVEVWSFKILIADQSEEGCTYWGTVSHCFHIPFLARGDGRRSRYITQSSNESETSIGGSSMDCVYSSQGRNPPLFIIPLYSACCSNLYSSHL